MNALGRRRSQGLPPRQCAVVKGNPVAVVSLILLVLGWVVILVGAFGTGIDITVGNLDPLTTGIVFVLGGLTLRAMD